MSSLNPPSAAPSPRDDAAAGSGGLAERLERRGWLLFAVAAVIATALVLWLGRGRTFSADELIWFRQTPDLGLRGAIEPHIGHLILTTRIAYKAIYSTLGVGYLPFRLLTMATVVLTAGLFFVFAGRRVGKLAALAPTLVLLVFGSDADHLLSGNGFTVVGALACGLGALLALDRQDRRGDVLACGLLCLGVVTYTIALAFVVGAAVSILLRADRWRRIWIALVPTAIYAAWWLWALGLDSSSEGQIAIADVLLFPAWAFQSLSSGLSALCGLAYPFGEATPDAGAALALAALLALGWRLQRAPVPRALWASLAIAATLWMMGAISKSVVRVPDSPRYLFPTAVVVLIVAACAAAGIRWRRPALIALLVLATAGVATNVALARQAGASSRGETAEIRADLAGIEIAGVRGDPSYVPADAPYSILFSFGTEGAGGGYVAATERYGRIGYTPEELRASPEPVRARADAALVGALGLRLRPAATSPGAGGCDELGPGPGRAPSIELAPGQAVFLGSARPATVRVRRFATTAGVEVGTLQPGRFASLAVPADDVAAHWLVSSDSPVRACVTG